MIHKLSCRNYLIPFATVKGHSCKLDPKNILKPSSQGDSRVRRDHITLSDGTTAFCVQMVSSTTWWSYTHDDFELAIGLPYFWYFLVTTRETDHSSPSSFSDVRPGESFQHHCDRSGALHWSRALRRWATAPRGSPGFWSIRPKQGVFRAGLEPTKLITWQNDYELLDKCYNMLIEGYKMVMTWF